MGNISIRTLNLKKRKVKQRSIRLKEYEGKLRDMFPTTIVDQLFDLIENYLPCGTCKRVLPLDSFANCSANINRKGKYGDCRECAKNNYNETKRGL